MSNPRRALPSRRAAPIFARRGTRPVLVLLGMAAVTIGLAGFGAWNLLQAFAPTPVRAVPASSWELTDPAPPPPPADPPAGLAAESGEPTKPPRTLSAPSSATSTQGTTAAPTSQPSATQPSTSGARLIINDLAVEAPIDVVGSRDGELLVPVQLDRVGLWNGGAQLGDAHGTVLVAGHLAIGDRPGVGYRWAELAPDAEVVTVGEQGTEQRWRAVRMTVYDGYELPVDLFDHGGPRRLALVTCSGPVVTVQGRREYRDNVVIIAEPVD